MTDDPRISGMTHKAVLPASGARVPVVIDGDATNYNYDLGADLVTRGASVATRTELAALPVGQMVAVLTESGREGTFVWSSANLQTLVTADTQQGIYVPPTGGNGSTGAWVRKFSGSIDARWFGAAFDGTTTDTTALQAAINYVSTGGGGAVLLPEGSAKTGTLNRPENVTIQGQGKYATRLVATTGLNVPLIQSIGTIGAPINRGGVIGLTIVGSGKANTGMIGIKNVFTNRCVIRDVDVHATYRGIWSENIWQDVWDNVHVHGGGSDQNYMGFYMAPKDATVGVSNAVIASSCVAQGVEKWGWRLENFNGSKFAHCEGLDGENGWYLGAPSSGSEIVQFGTFTDCLSDTSSSYNWRIEKGAASDMKRLQFDNCWAGTAGAANVWVAGGAEIVFTNWQAVAAQTHGFHFYNCSRCSVTGSSIRDYNTANGANHGVLLENAQFITLTGNHNYTITPGTGKAVAETGTSDNNIAVGNVLAWGITFIGANSFYVDAGFGIHMGSILSLNAAGILQAAAFPAQTGDVTNTVGTVSTTIANGAVSLAKMANMATASLIYRKTAGTGTPEVNTLATLKTDLGLTGTNSGDQVVAQCKFDHFADAGNSGTSETDLYSDTIAAGQLAANGDKLTAEYGGLFVAHATATRQVKLYFGGTAIFDSGALASTTAEKWTLDALIIRVSATVVRYSIKFVSATATGAALVGEPIVGELTGLTLSNTNILKITGTAAAAGAATNDIVARLGTVSYAPAA